MRHEDSNKGHSNESQSLTAKHHSTFRDDIVLEKDIFNAVFEKDIRRVFIYKKAERLAKAVHLITPAFDASPSLRNRIDAVSIGLVDAAILSSAGARLALSRELLTLSSLLSIARTAGLLSPMNADLITREAQALLQEVAAYQEPRLLMDEVPSISTIARQQTATESRKSAPRRAPSNKGHVKDISNVLDGQIKDRQESILSVIRDKPQASIKDISILIRGVSEKTIQRELAALIAAGVIVKEGERRWSTYSLV